MKRKLSIAISLVVILTMTLTSLALAADPPAQVVFTTDLPCPVSVLVISYTDPNGVIVNFVSGSTPWTLDTSPSTLVSFTYQIPVDCDGVTYTSVVFSTKNPVLSGTPGSITPVIGAYRNRPPAWNVPADFSVEATGPAGALATYFASASDPDAGDTVVSQSCLPTSGSTFPLGTTTVTCTATDTFGVTGTASFHVTVADTTPPTVTVPADITSEATNPAGKVIDFSPSANDTVDGPIVPTCVPPSGSVFALGTTLVTCSATDAHDNTGTASFNVTVILADITPPVWTIPTDFSVDATEPTGTFVTYIASASDPDDAVISQFCSPASGSTFPLGTTTVTCTATDSHGNTGTASFTVTVKPVDTTPPIITFVSRLPAPNSLGWNNSDVSVTWSCSDNEGVLSPTVTEVISMEGAALSATGTCTDTSGNTASDTQPGINIDKTAPTLSPSISPLPVVLNSNPSLYTVSAGASDALSGVDTQGCAGGVDTSSVGWKSLTCTATDKAGNSSSVPVSYNVQYAPEGTQCKGVAGHQILQPINADGSSVFKQGQTVSAKFRVCGADGNPIASPGVVTDFRLVQVISQDIVSNVDEAVESTPPHDVFRSGNGQWIFNISTKDLLADTTYVYDITLNDGSTVQFQFTLK